MRRINVTLAIACLTATPWLATGVASADDAQVNVYTTGRQGFPSVALDADGDFVVVWHSEGSGGTDASGYSIQGRRYASDGTALGGEFQVNTYTTSGQSHPEVALDADGDFVVVWVSLDPDVVPASNSIQGQRFASDGTALGGEFRVNTYNTGLQRFPEVALDADGDFVVVWHSPGSGGTDSSFSSIQGQRYAADGTASGGEFQVNTYTTNNQFTAAVGLDADGDFVVSWISRDSGGTDASSYSVQGQRYAADGTALGDQFQVNTYTTGGQYRSSVALDADGDFLIVWDGFGSGGTDTSSLSVHGQRYASDGSMVGEEFQVNSYTTSLQTLPTVGVDADGDFIVAWYSYGSGGTDSSSNSIQARRYTSDGSNLSVEHQVNTYTTASQIFASVGMGADGAFVVVWESDGSGGTDVSDESIQRSPVVLIFADGFESGDTASWSSTTTP